jgi:ElaB/YqjD/DUF883 family membrane-anchored ribosome-binding protein
MDVASEQMKSKADNAVDNVGEMGHRAVDAAQKKLKNMKETASEYYDKGMEKAEEYQSNVEEYVREQPMKSLAIAIGAGFLIGFLFTRRS